MNDQFSAPEITSPPSISIVIEWDNPVYSDLSRAREMLKRLGVQLDSITGKVKHPVELILVCDPNTADPAWVETEAREHIGPAAGMVEIKVMGVRGIRYYEMKNIGARQTNGNVIIFIDSDVIPENEWLESLLSAICRKNVAVVGGITYVETNTFLQRAFAVFWPFQTRTDETTLVSGNRFFANNVAFRREVFLSNPFPELPCYRMQSYILSQMLISKGYTIYQYNAARVEHPALNGVRHFIIRALCVGHDRIFYSRYQKDQISRQEIVKPVTFRHKIFEKLVRIKTRRGKLNITAWELPFVCIIAITYYGIAVLGALITFLNADWFRRHFINISEVPSR